MGTQKSRLNEIRETIFIYRYYMICVLYIAEQVQSGVMSNLEDATVSTGRFAAPLSCQGKPGNYA